MAAMDRMKTVNALLAGTPHADQAGNFSAFGLSLVELPAFLWTAFSEKLMRAVRAARPESEEAHSLLENAAARFAYHAGRGIFASAEFRAAAGASTGEGPEALLNAAFCLAAAWGWADAEIVTLHPKESMVVRARAYAEAALADTMPMVKPAAAAFRGICRAFMDLAYGAQFPDGLGSYACRQTLALELGDAYGEFIVTRAEA
jgi:hypothetical protein